MISPLLGGIEQAFLDYTKALSSYNHQVLDIICKHAQIKEKIPLEKESILEISFLHYNYFLVIYLYLKLRKFKPDLIIVHNKKAIPIFRMLAKLLKTKIVGVSHNPKYKHIGTCDGIFTITQYQKDIFSLKGFPQDKIFVIPNLIEQTLPFKPAKEFHNPPIIGTMGRFDPMKGFGDFVQALFILKQQNIPFHAIIGGGVQKSYQEEYDNIRKLTNDLNLKNDITFCGWVHDKNAFFNNIDIFVLPSRFEPFGIVLLEAMMYSKPIVSSLAEGPAEIFASTPDAAYLFPVKDPLALAEKLTQALQDFSKTKEIAHNGYNLCLNNYTLENVALKLHNAVSTFKKER